MLDPLVMLERAADGAAAAVGQVRPDQLHLPTPCTGWDVAALVGHLTAGPAYLLGALGLDPGPPAADEAAYRATVARCLDALREPEALRRSCRSPLGGEWTVDQAVAGTAMDQLVHTWDLAVAIDADRRLDPDVTRACVVLFLPHMPELGRQAGIVGPPVPVPDDASAQDRLLAAMGRRP